MQQISADIRYREGGFVEAISFLAEKKKKEKKTALTLHSITRDQHRYINKCAKSSLYRY